MNDSQPISCEHEGITLRGLVAAPAGRGPHPAVLVVHTAYGLGEHMKEVAARLAAEGYLSLAVDMFGDGAYSENHSDGAEFVKPLWGNCAPDGCRGVSGFERCGGYCRGRRCRHHQIRLDRF
jgi:dienelactone hydrolase